MCGEAPEMPAMMTSTDGLTAMLNNECWIGQGTERMEVQRVKLMYRILCVEGNRPDRSRTTSIAIAD